jgi:hypothetical protein
MVFALVAKRSENGPRGPLVRGNKRLAMDGRHWIVVGKIRSAGASYAYEHHRVTTAVQPAAARTRTRTRSVQFRSAPLAPMTRRDEAIDGPMVCGSSVAESSMPRKRLALVSLSTVSAIGA